MCIRDSAYVINIMVVLIIFPVILQTDINVIMLSIGGEVGGLPFNTLPVCSASAKATTVLFSASSLSFCISGPRSCIGGRGRACAEGCLPQA